MINAYTEWLTEAQYDYFKCFYEVDYYEWRWTRCDLLSSRPSYVQGELL